MTSSSESSAAAGNLDGSSLRRQVVETTNLLLKAIEKLESTSQLQGSARPGNPTSAMSAASSEPHGSRSREPCSLVTSQRLEMSCFPQTALNVVASLLKKTYAHAHNYIHMSVVE